MQSIQNEFARETNEQKIAQPASSNYPVEVRHDDEVVDVVIIGSGFGGSMAALRLIEKGYRVAVLEAGRRFDEQSLPKTSWDLRSFL